MARGPAAEAQNEQRAAFIADVRRLMRHGRAAVLSTTFRGREAWPYASLVTTAPDVDGRPLFLFSDLSDHTQNLKKDARAALLFEEGSRRKNPQRGARVTLMGKVRKTKDERHRRRFLARHPEAGMYAGFGDFNFHVMSIERIHYVGGFARAQWIKPAEIALPRGAAKALAEAEESVIAHMNADHADAVDLYANRLLGRRGSGWRLIGADPLGVDLMRDGNFARLDFAAPVADAVGLRKALVEFAARARG